MRRLHSFAGLVAAALVIFMALTGAILSIQPALEVAGSHSSGAVATVAELAGKVVETLPAVERITRSASGTVVAYFLDGNTHVADQIDPATGGVLGPYAPSAFFGFMTELHRSLFLGQTGRAIAGMASARGKRNLAIGLGRVATIWLLK